MENYSVSIVETSKELTAKERIAFKDLTDVTKLDEATKFDNVIITPVDYAILSVHNPKSANPDYENYVVIANDGKRYVTGSPSFWSAFKGIYDEMAGSGEEYQIKIYRKESKNYMGKDFITCSIL